jgi:hypothetical protein
MQNAEPALFHSNAIGLLERRPAATETDGDDDGSEGQRGQRFYGDQSERDYPKDDGAINALLLRPQVAPSAADEHLHLSIPQTARQPRIEVGLDPRLILFVQSGETGTGAFKETRALCDRRRLFRVNSRL